MEIHSVVNHPGGGVGLKLSLSNEELITLRFALQLHRRHAVELGREICRDPSVPFADQAWVSMQMADTLNAHTRAIDLAPKGAAADDDSHASQDDQRTEFDYYGQMLINLGKALQDPKTSLTELIPLARQADLNLEFRVVPPGDRADG